jgi:hypothetical protein
MFKAADGAADILGKVICRKRAERKALCPQVPVEGRHAGRARPEAGGELRDRQEMVVVGGAGGRDRGSEGAEPGSIGWLEEQL